ncbi:hypothetical protein GFB56_35010 [Ensifer sp. T173]|uniref:Uncharacterized protein n=1 Tax=Ensifer canadensis TaxID=555315 RepID=A0AAW4FWR4_9HYPH|nr:hypothetical protein [Ensifer canadensis]MBM3095901.1 hypothetical protein [Ensifer canadensis]UBI77649.1 hypothetical protein J3R84_24080 [Ensifer canadensis]
MSFALRQVEASSATLQSMSRMFSSDSFLASSLMSLRDLSWLVPSLEVTVHTFPKHTVVSACAGAPEAMRATAINVLMQFDHFSSVGRRPASMRVPRFEWFTVQARSENGQHPVKRKSEWRHICAENSLGRERAVNASNFTSVMVALDRYGDMFGLDKSRRLLLAAGT